MISFAGGFASSNLGTYFGWNIEDDVSGQEVKLLRKLSLHSLSLTWPYYACPPSASLALLVYLRPEFTNGSVQKMDSAWGRQVGHQRATSPVLSSTTASGSLSHKLPPPGHEIPAQRRRRNRSNRPHMQQIRLDPFLSAGIHWPQTEAVGIFQISHAPRSWAADLLHARSFTKRLEVIS